MHEFLHALGFHHEHMRADRDDDVTIHWDNIEPGMNKLWQKGDDLGKGCVYRRMFWGTP